MRRSLGCTLGLALLLVGCAQPGSIIPSASSRNAESLELSAYLSQASQEDAQRFKQADANHDGRLSPAELPQVSSEDFAALDANHDGSLSLAEASLRGDAAQQRAELLKEVESALPEAERQGLTAKPAAQGGNPVIMVPGYLDLKVFWTLVDRNLRGEGRQTFYCDLFPNISDIRGAAEQLKKQVAEVKAKTGARKVDIVGHSMGGLITRYYIKNLGGLDQVAHVVTLATPNHGTIVSLLGPGRGADQMHPGSEFLKELNAGDETPGDIPYTSIRAGMDEIVVPHDSPIQEGADNELVPHAMHGTIFLSSQTWNFLQAGLKR